MVLGSFSLPSTKRMAEEKKSKGGIMKMITEKKEDDKVGKEGKMSNNQVSYMSRIKSMKRERT